MSNIGIQVRPEHQQRRALPFSEADLLKGLTPRKAHADEVVIVTDAIVGNYVRGNDKRS
jgi:hypothetical protein